MSSATAEIHPILLKHNCPSSTWVWMPPFLVEVENSRNKGSLRMKLGVEEELYSLSTNLQLFAFTWTLPTSLVDTTSHIPASRVVVPTIPREEASSLPALQNRISNGTSFCLGVPFVFSILNHVTTVYRIFLPPKKGLLTATTTRPA